MYLPVICISGGDVAYIEANTVGQTFVDSGATCFDAQDGLLYANQKSTATLDESKLGSTALGYTCVDKDRT